ncbi:MAG: helix-turn-helix domain-containing protein [Bacteroidales bacterium]|nr:helix-turn-helix domain-containing protein [Bacteroidales bacterium]MCF8336511.1 helix-turn-helix domain-containing protein [Bacteroidales bacterium]
MVDRLELLLQAKNLNSSQLADEIDVQRSIMSHVMNGRNKASLDFVLRILKRFNDINPDWLLFGKGSMTRENNLFSQEQSEANNSLKQENQELKQQNEQLQQTLQKLQQDKEQLQNSSPQVTPGQSEGQTENNDAKEEDTPGYGYRATNSKAIQTIVALYSDGTFREYQKS